MRRSLRKVAVAAFALALGGCAMYQPLESTPEDIVGNVGPGDSVRVVTRDRNEMELLVTAIDDAELRGRLDGDGESVRLSFDAIDLIEVHRFSMRRTLLGVVLPVVAGAVIACNNDDCRTRSTIDADL